MSEQNPQNHSHAYHVDRTAHKDGALLHGHGEHHAGGHHGDEEHGDHGSFKSYVTGFILSVILTAIPFWLVMAKVFDSATTGYVVLAFAAVQVVVHMIYFLHMNTRAEGGWSMLALVFTAVILFIMLSGSLWVMYHMNHNMIPGLMHDM
jgi:cytochrome o ubiquinol oxidase operon protein cyoD